MLQFTKRGGGVWLIPDAREIKSIEEDVNPPGGRPGETAVVIYLLVDGKRGCIERWVNEALATVKSRVEAALGQLRNGRPRNLQEKEDATEAQGEEASGAPEASDCSGSDAGRRRNGRGGRVSSSK